MPEPETPTDPTARLQPGSNEIRVRLYSQGLGDCFLLAFPRPGQSENPCYLLIDCGSAIATPGGAKRSREIAENIRVVTGGHLDILVITHQHYDHISGFQDAWDIWRDFTIDNLYLPWSDSTKESDEIKSVERLRTILTDAAERARSREVLPVPRDLGEADNPNTMSETMTFIRSLSPNPPRYFYPGDVFRLPGTNSHGYVLGPPRPLQLNKHNVPYIEQLIVDPDEEPGVMYSYRDHGMDIDTGTGPAPSFALSDDKGLPAAASAILASETLPDSDLRDSDDCYSPFAPALRLEWDAALSGGFFQATYENSKDTWRKIDDDWLYGAASLGLRAGGFTNNTSFVLAFDQPDTDKMLLFPGDAQVGNWLSWHDITEWRQCDPLAEEANLPAADPATAPHPRTLMENLLARVAFYKVGHHGSHNATIKDKGLAKMTRSDLVAYVPVSVPVAQDSMSYCPMPFYPVIRALQTATRGRVFLPNGKAIEPLPEGLTPGQEQAELRKSAKITLAGVSLDITKEEKNKKTVVIEEMPLYLEYTQTSEPTSKPSSAPT
ncbi:MAG: MBL fold metallo-hydrolase [Armatimonas sp.]